MVLIDGVKYACQACIKGHRSTKCTHTARPLVEIKKKGRPTSQCSHCRELRKVNSVHGKCNCEGRELDAPAPAAQLPNGLKDAIQRMASPPPGTPPAPLTGLRVSQLLNPCNCRRGGKCSCCTVVKRVRVDAGPSSSGASTPSLVSSPASSCCSAKPAAPPEPTFNFNSDVPVASTSTLPTIATPSLPSARSSCCAPAPAPAPADTTPVPVIFSPPPFPPLSTALFLPSTMGTAACFCGDSCACVGCLTHDPHSRKRRAPDEGGPSCGCGTDECDMVLGMASCGGDRAGAFGLEELLRAGEVALPSLWSAEQPRENEGALPSLADLWKDVDGVYERGPFEGLESGAGWDGGDAKVDESLGCSSMYAEEAFDGGCGEQCTCSDTCGCRGGIGEEDPDADVPVRGAGLDTQAVEADAST